MSTLEARIAKLETRQGTTAERTAFQLDDATLERIIVAFLVSATPEEIEAELSAHPEFRELYVELMPKALELYQARNENQVRRKVGQDYASSSGRLKLTARSSDSIHSNHVGYFSSTTSSHQCMI